MITTFGPRDGDFWIKADKTLRHYAQGLVKRLRGSLWDAHPRLAERPLFVVGCSRAGTTLVYQTLSEADELGSRRRESHDFWAQLHPLSERRWESHALDAGHANLRDRELVSRFFYTETGRRRFADKNNQNGLAVRYLYALFPSAHFVYVKRNPGDNLHSLIVGWGKPDQFATWSRDLPLQVGIDGGRYKRWCFFLPPQWRDFTGASIEDVCGWQYQSMNEAILEAKTVIPEQQWTEVKYEDILRDPVEVFGQVFTSTNLRFGKRQRILCETVLSRPYNAFSEIRPDKWRNTNNSDRIERVLPRLKTLVEMMGYE